MRWLKGIIPTGPRGLRPVRTLGRPWRGSRLAMMVLGVSAWLVTSAGLATAFFTAWDPTRWLEQAWRSLWIACLLLQAVGTLWMTVIVRPPHARDLLRTTPQGVDLWLRGEWWHGLWRARVLLLYAVLLRMAMIGLLLVEVTAMRGRYLDLIAAFGMAEPLPVPLLMMLLATGMTVALLLPLAALGADAALGVLFAYTLRERTFALSYQLGWVLARWVGMAGMLWLYERVSRGDVMIELESALPLYVASVLVGDHGATFTSLTRMAQAWAELPHSPWAAMVGAGTIVLYLGLIEVCLCVARHRQERHD